jgi:hypothetical protein
MSSSGARRSGTPELIGLGVVLSAPVCVVWLTGALAGLLASGHPLQIGLAGAARVLTRIPPTSPDRSSRGPRTRAACCRARSRCR